MKRSLIADHLNLARDRFYWAILPELLERLGFSTFEAGRQIAWGVVYSPTWCY